MLSRVLILDVNEEKEEVVVRETEGIDQDDSCPHSLYSFVMSACGTYLIPYCITLQRRDV